MKNPWIWQGLNGDIATSLVIGGLDFGHFIFLPNLFLRGFRGFLNWDTQKNKWLLFAESNGKMGYLNYVLKNSDFGTDWPFLFTDA